MQGLCQELGPLSERMTKDFTADADAFTASCQYTAPGPLAKTPV